VRFLDGLPFALLRLLVLRHGLDLAIPEPALGSFGWTVAGAVSRLVATFAFLLLGTGSGAACVISTVGYRGAARAPHAGSPSSRRAWESLRERGNERRLPQSSSRTSVLR